ncbi:MAG: phosphoenolpyruvate--protein phosphotransferase [FCB group bacterium]|nr:phosphoenolpyruvate--protein phosphotransferase [FCB group bacterium]
MDKIRKILKGTPISDGVVFGQARVILPGDIDVVEIVIPASQVKDEIEALEKAIEVSIVELRKLRSSASKEIEGPVAKIFDAQLLIASDYEFLEKVKKEIKLQKRNAGYIYNKLVKSTTDPLKNSPDAYMRQMVIDIEAVSKRVLSHLGGYEHCDLKFPPNTILVGKMFTPGDILNFRQQKAIGFLVSEGGKNSHMALIARALMLPAVVVKNSFLEINNYSRLILDGTSGEVIINPTDEDWSEYQKLKKRQGPALVTRIKKLTTIPPLTADGKAVNVGANLSFSGPVDNILVEKKIPVGLYRTEFIYLSNYQFPEEDMQFEYYSEIAEKFADSYVVLRTFDLGYDKLAVNNHWPQEDNPALGWRGMRAMLDMVNIFKAQIRAILRASTHRNLKIMLPMVSDVSELIKAKKLIAQVKFQLRKKNIPFDENIQIGIMIEVPSAVLTIDTFLDKVDFISIGTNDLTQYTLASDRMNNRVANLFSVFHPSVLKLILMTVEACKKHNKPVSICGEVAGDLLALPLFIGMEIDLLSMNPVRIFDLCRMVKKIDSSIAKMLLASVMKSDTQQQVLNKLRAYKMELEKRKSINRRK